MAIVSPKERIAINDSKSDSPDALAASIVGPKPEGRAEKDNRRFRIRSSGKTRERPLVKSEDKECLATWTQVGGLRAWTLWDSGSTTSGITPQYAELAKIVVDTLADPHILQLGTVGVITMLPGSKQKGLASGYCLCPCQPPCPICKKGQRPTRVWTSPPRKPGRDKKET